jgi:cobalt/nickel transport system permease protein
MTHMHIPDGILPVWLWLAGFVLSALALSFSLFRLREMDARKKIPLLGALSAAMLVGMSIPVLPGYHINLSVVAGILIGPSLGLLAAFIANVILALMGHGGITVIGLNTVLLGSEAVLGHLFFTLLRRIPVFWRSALATVVTLFITTMLLIGIVAVSHINLELLHEGEGHAHPAGPEGSVSLFSAIVLSLGAIGWIIEAAITGAVVKFIAQVQPALLGHSLHRQGEPEKDQEKRSD